VDGGVDQVGGEAAAAHRDVVPVEDVADRSSFDAEPGTQLVHGGPGSVPGDEFLDLVGVEPTCPPWFGSGDGRWSRCGWVGQLSEQGFQGFYRGLCVVISSPKVHS
jgi:hypothetical protein